MTTVVLTLDKETKRFDLDDGPTYVHAGETVKLVLRGIGINAEKANGVSIPEGTVDEEDGSDLAAAYPYLRARLLHPAFGDVAMYPWPGTGAEWEELDPSHPGTGIKCQIDLDTEQLFRVVRSGYGDEIVLYVETPWPESAPTVYGTYALRVADWPEATGEVRVYPTTGRYVNAASKLVSVQAIDRETATLRDTIDTVNTILGALKTIALRNGEES